MAFQRSSPARYRLEVWELLCVWEAILRATSRTKAIGVWGGGVWMVPVRGDPALAITIAIILAVPA